MAVSTHRWRPDSNVKSGYSFKKKYKYGKYSKNKDNCFISMKFENSLYFVGVRYPVHTVYKLSKTVKRLSEERRRSSISFNQSIGEVVFKKLYASEYVMAQSVDKLTRLKDSLVRNFIIADDQSYLDDSVNIAESIKMKMSTDVWSSFRLVIIAKRCDIRNEILQKDSLAIIPKPFVMKAQILEETAEDDRDEPDNESSNTPYDEDDETRLISTMANSKFRDSRIIIANKKKVNKQPDVDPIERCFTALMKMMEDNIFSASRGLKEVNFQIGYMLKESEIDSNDIKISEDSDNLDVSNI